MKLGKYSLFYMFFATPLLWSQIQDFGSKGHIDWNKREIVAKGIGAPNPNMPAVTARPMALQAARTVALRNALEVIKGVNINSSTTVENYMVTQDHINKSVQGYIRTFKESKPKYMSDKTIEITVTVPLNQTINETLLPTEIKPQPAQYPSSSLQASQNFTGLIVDARGLGAMPAMAPKIFNASGKEVFGSAYVSRKWATKWGMVGYAKSPEQASSMTDRIGKQPGIIKATATKGANKTDLQISDQDAQTIAAAAKSMNFLSDCRIIFIVD